MNKRFALVAAALGAALSAGCTPSNLAPVTGVVTLDGKPVEKAVVIFQMLPEGSPVSNAVTDAQGKFTLATEDELQPGALIGTHGVAIRKLDIEGFLPTDDGLSGFTPIGSYREIWHIPKKYGDMNQPLFKVEVKAGMEPVKLEMKSDPVETE